MEIRYISDLHYNINKEVIGEKELKPATLKRKLTKFLESQFGGKYGLEGIIIKSYHSDEQIKTLEDKNNALQCIKRGVIECDKHKFKIKNILSINWNDSTVFVKFNNLHVEEFHNKNGDFEYLKYIL